MATALNKFAHGKPWSVLTLLALLATLISTPVFVAGAAFPAPSPSPSETDDAGDERKPPAPTGLAATVGDGEVTLWWDTPESAVTGYSYSYATSLSEFNSASPPAWHAIPVPVESEEVNIKTTGRLNTVGTLEDSEGGELASKDDGGNFSIWRDLSGGTYYVRIESDGTSIGAYTLRLSNDGNDSDLGDDHGDAWPSATGVTLPSETAGRIEPGSDVDVFRFEVAETREVTIETTGSLDTVGTLLDFAADSWQLAHDDDGGSGTNFGIRRILPEGTYHVRVRSYDSSTGPYTLRLTADEVVDHGDARSSATRVALPSETKGRIEPSSDVDYFRFEVSETREVTIETTGGLDTVGTLYDSEGAELASNDNDGSRYNFSIRRSLSRGTYYVRVGADRYGLYRLRVTADGDSGGLDDHGDARSSATPVAAPSETPGQIYPGYTDVDYFRFALSETREVTIKTAPTRGGREVRTEGKLYDGEGEELASNTLWGDNGIRRSLPVGTYYVRVESDYDSSGHYMLQLAVEGDDGRVEDDHGDARSSATRVALPSETAGRIEPGVDGATSGSRSPRDANI